jgi:hypothetical protein
MISKEFLSSIQKKMHFLIFSKLVRLYLFHRITTYSASSANIICNRQIIPELEYNKNVFKEELKMQ